MINLLVLTTLYPNSEQPRHGIFIETRLKELRKSGDISATIIAPVPWFPIASERFGQYGTYAKVPRVEEREGVTVHHPRYLVLPKIGMYITPFFLAVTLLLTTLKLARQGNKFDLIDAHYFYPDGVAAALVSLFVRLPLVISARGSDVNVLPCYWGPRKLIQWAGRRANAVVAVSETLRKKILGLGIPPERTYTLRNGVDTGFFKRSSSQTNANSSDSLALLSVGNLVELKGHHLVIEALAQLPDSVKLTVVGSGPQEAALRQLARELELEERVSFVSNVLQHELVEIYSRSDLMVLASSREGWANVILEALACGVPVVATNVGGAKEAITDSVAGLVIDERSATAIAKAIEEVCQKGFAPEAASDYAQNYGWDEVVTKQVELYKGVTKHA
ncbi:glycosyltransferase family 4 protein [Neptunomonas marina]|nr:glycosyltransferase family 4 protein [Neptunomonas marina]